MSRHSDSDAIIEIILILFFPPLAVWYHDRQCGGHACFNLCLLFLFVFPSIIHALWYCFMRDDDHFDDHDHCAPQTVIYTTQAPPQQMYPQVPQQGQPQYSYPPSEYGPPQGAPAYPPAYPQAK